MQLQELLADLETLDDEEIICVRPPWRPDADARLTAPDENLAVPDDVKRAGYDYFLEVDVAKEGLGVFGSKPGTVDERVRLLIYYAQNDAYPDWVYHR